MTDEKPTPTIQELTIENRRLKLALDKANKVIADFRLLKYGAYSERTDDETLDMINRRNQLNRNQLGIE